MEKRPEHKFPTAEARKEEARKLFLVEPDAIVVLSMGIVRREGKENSSYKSTSYDDTDSHGLLGGGKAAVIAGAEAHKLFPEATLVTNSYTKGVVEPTHAAVMARELQTYGVPEDLLVLEEESVSTSTELTELIKVADTKGWKKIAIITNDFHRERTEEMYSHLGTLFGADDPEFMTAFERFKEAGGSIEFVEAESLLKLRDIRYEPLIDRVHETEAYHKRVEMEQKGLEQLKDGTYGQKRPSST